MATADEPAVAAPVFGGAVIGTVVVTVLVFLQLWNYIYRAPRRRAALPPGPPALPVVGHLHLLGDLPHQSLWKLSQRYGPIMWLRLGTRPMLVASSPETAKEILKTHDLAFADRPVTSAGVHVLSNCSDIATSNYGPYWKLMRHLVMAQLFSAKRLDGFRPVRSLEIRSLRSSLLRTAGDAQGPVTVRKALLETSHNINCRMVTGTRISDLQGLDDGSNLLDSVDEVMYLFGIFPVGDLIPWLAWLDVHGYVKRMKSVGRRTNAILQKVIDSRRASRGDAGGSPPAKDLLDILLDASVSNEHGIVISDDQIKAVIMDLFVGGSDTSAVSIEWALAELLQNPAKLKKAQEELDNVVGKDRLVEESDIPNLPYLCAVVKEVMRLHPPAPLLIPHLTKKEIKLLGYTIPANTHAYVNLCAIGRDSNIWEKPMEFSPERFLDNTMDMKGQYFELLPFGSGRRICPGISLGLIVVHFMLATLLQSFSWSIPSNVQTIDMSERFGLTVNMAQPLTAFVAPRMPIDLY